MAQRTGAAVRSGGGAAAAGVGRADDAHHRK